MRQRFICLTVVVVLTCSSLNAQVWDRMTTPQTAVSVQHAPTVKVPLEHVAFGESQGGACADALSDALMADFAASGAVVVDRAHLKTLVAEHKLNVSGMVDEATAAKIGKLIGSGALIFVKVHDCAVTHAQKAQDYTDKDGNRRRSYITTTHGSLRASVQATNLTTGVTLGARMINAAIDLPKEGASGGSFAARLLNATASALVSSSGSGDGTPPDDVVLTDLQNEAVDQVHKLFFSWSETRKLHIYDDKECSLNTTFRLLRGGDNEGAAAEAQASLETCKNKPSVKPANLAHAYYNVGMTQFILEKHEEALEALGQAVRLDGGTIITDAMTECRRAQALARELKARQEQVPAPAISRVQPAPAQTSAKVSSPEERLQKLTELHKKGIVTDAEYKAKRAEILKDM
jgi:tetratricopeptide (TPR) repeat protein